MCLLWYRIRAEIMIILGIILLLISYSIWKYYKNYRPLSDKIYTRLKTIYDCVDYNPTFIIEIGENITVKYKYNEVYINNIVAPKYLRKCSDEELYLIWQFLNQ